MINIQNRAYMCDMRAHQVHHSPYTLRMAHDIGRMRTYACITTQILKDQMQALVLATSEVVVNRLTDECYPTLVNVYEDAMRSRR